MKKPLTLLALLISLAALADTSGQLNLRASVPGIVSIQINPTSIASSLPLDTTQNRVRVAESVENWNTLRGTRIIITSANKGHLVNAGANNAKIPYSLYFWGVNVNLAGTHWFIRGQSGVQRLVNPLEMSYSGTPHADLAEGEYSDTVTLAISAN